VDRVRAVPTVTCVAAWRVVEAALLAAASEPVDICVAVADPAGNLVAFARMDGAPLLSARIAQDKAFTVSAFNGLATHAWYDLIAQDPALLHGIVHTERLVIFGGGVALCVGGQRIGAVGVSGGSAEQDRRVAETAAAALELETVR
jgi:glc operon protein GlcG